MRSLPSGAPVSSLGDRFDLAFGLVIDVGNIVAIGWIHRALRNDNILLFSERTNCKVQLVGRTYARENEAPGQLSNLLVENRWVLHRPLSVDRVAAGGVALDNEDARSGEDEYSAQGKEMQSLDGETSAII